MQPPELHAAFGWGALSASGLLIGALIGATCRLSHRRIALAVSVAAGLLVGAASVELAVDAIRVAGTVPAVIALLAGAATMSTANVLLAEAGASNRKRCGDCVAQPSESEQPGSGVAIALGIAVDSVPESLVLGLALGSGTVPVELLLAISIGNFPEALAGAGGMRLAGRSNRYIAGLWGSIALGATVLTAAGFAAFGWIGQAWTPLLQAVGAGALLAMTAETMIPEAVHGNPRFSGFVLAAGFCVVLLAATAH